MYQGTEFPEFVPGPGCSKPASARIDQSLVDEACMVMCVHLCIYMYIYIYSYIYTNTYMYVYICIYMFQHI